MRDRILSYSSTTVSRTKESFASSCLSQKKKSFLPEKRQEGGRWAFDRWDIRGTFHAGEASNPYA